MRQKCKYCAGIASTVQLEPYLFVIAGFMNTIISLILYLSAPGLNSGGLFRQYLPKNESTPYSLGV
jgi:hypothetical protein